jgi:hypothetical protein
MIFVVILLLTVLLGILSFFIIKDFKKKQIAKSLGLKLLLISLPSKSKDTNASLDFKDEINLSAQLFSILAGLGSEFCLEAAVHYIGEEIHFYIIVPRESISAISRQIEGLWKDAQVEEVGDYNIFNVAGVTRGFFLKQKLSPVLPIRTYMEVNVDTFAPILSGLSKINDLGEGAVIQVLARPAPASFKKLLQQLIIRLKKGASFDELFKGLNVTFKDIEKTVFLAKQKNKNEDKIIDEEAIKALQAKLEKPLLEVNLRVLVSAARDFEADSLLESIGNGFFQFTAPLRNELKIVKPRKINDLIYQFSFRQFDNNQKMILNTEELASLFHLPSSSTVIPKIKWLKTKEAPPPVNLPVDGTLIGESIFRGIKKPVYITKDDRRRHIYIIGQTGTGKSTLLTNMAVDDIKKGEGVAVIDPHGDLIEKILSLMPYERLDDVIIFDPADILRPLGMNMLEYNIEKPEEKTFIVNEMQSIFNKLFLAETMGPMFEQYMKNALLLLMEDMSNEPATLMEVSRIFTDTAFRERKLSRITNPIIIDFWTKEAIRVGGEASLANMTPYITSKFNNFTTNDYMRPIIGQTQSAFNFRQIMDDGKILLVNLSKGRIGDINANLLGMIITGKILMAALSRVDILDQEKRRDFNLYIDEFQNFTTDSIATILSEARKYRLNLTMAHQFIAQLTDKIRDAVFGNVGSMIVFRVGTQDAEVLVKQFEPVFSENDLINIDNFKAYIRLLVNGQTVQPFNIHILPPQIGNLAMIEKLKEISRLKYGRDRQEVEKEIFARLRS